MEAEECTALSRGAAKTPTGVAGLAVAGHSPRQVIEQQVALGLVAIPENDRYPLRALEANRPVD